MGMRWHVWHVHGIRWRVHGACGGEAEWRGGVAIAHLQRSVSSVALPPSCCMKLRATLSSAVHEETDHHVITCVRLGEGCGRCVGGVGDVRGVAGVRGVRSVRGVRGRGCSPTPRLQPYPTALCPTGATTPPRTDSPCPPRRCRTGRRRRRATARCRPWACPRWLRRVAAGSPGSAAPGGPWG